MTAAEKRAYKAKQLRYKKPIAKEMNLDAIQSELWDMIEVCSDIHWYDNDEESLVNALDGDEDEAYEFKMAFSDLEARASYWGGYWGYDEHEGDYYGLEPYEYSWAEDEAARKIMKLTKKQILEVVGQCLKIAHAYMAIRYRYDCLEAAIEILRGTNMECIKIVKGIEEQYFIADRSSEGFKWRNNPEVIKFNNMLLEVPQEYWIQ